MEGEKIKWHKIAENSNDINWQSNGLAVVEVGARKVTVVKAGNELFACAHKCPHASGIMADGFIDALGNIVCPVHRYKFSLKNGRNVSGEGYYLKTYPLQEREAGIFIGFAESNWLDIFK
ncbi:MAG: ferredoxin [Segetibacter sp.]|nr:ferredoxin [Segetibacter sp.]